MKNTHLNKILIEVDVMINVIIVMILVAAVGTASYYIYKEKKKGRRCIGCPNSGRCSSAGSGCGCGRSSDK